MMVAVVVVVDVAAGADSRADVSFSIKQFADQQISLFHDWRYLDELHHEARLTVSSHDDK